MDSSMQKNPVFPVIGLDMSGILREEDLPLTQPLIDCRDLSGTDCYCDEIAEEEISRHLKDYGPEGIHYLDSGNYHYLTLFFLRKLPADQPFELILFDNHPDSKEPAFGDILSCGGWVRKAWDELPNLSKVTMIGVDPVLLKEEGFQLGENLLDRGSAMKPLHVQCLSKNGPEEEPDKDSDRGISVRTDSSDGIQDKMDADGWIPVDKNPNDEFPVYISIDKDVLREEDASCNWSQGRMSEEELLETVGKIYQTRQVLGMDICGEEDWKERSEGTKLNEARNQEIFKLVLSEAEK
jgi:arginase family enzyme